MRDQYVRPFGGMSSEPIQHSQDNQCFQGCGPHRGSTFDTSKIFSSLSPLQCGMIKIFFVLIK